MRLTKEDERKLKELAKQGRLIARVGGHEQATTLPPWTMDETALGRAIVRLMRKE